MTLIVVSAMVAAKRSRRLTKIQLGGVWGGPLADEQSLDHAYDSNYRPSRVDAVLLF
jgi:hypothetical protein